MSIAVTNDHRHRHLHNERSHGGSCTCRSCHYDGSVGDLLKFRNAVERIGQGGEDGVDSAAGSDRTDAGRAPAGTPGRTIERLNDEVANYTYHRGSFSVYA